MIILRIVIILNPGQLKLFTKASKMITIKKISRKKRTEKIKIIPNKEIEVLLVVKVEAMKE
jgi:hypothetical protein